MSLRNPGPPASTRGRRRDEEVRGKRLGSSQRLYLGLGSVWCYQEVTRSRRCGAPSACPMSVRTRCSTEMTPVRGNNEKHASANERKACDNRSRRSHLEGRDLSGDE